jgi:hypothetical protein
MKASRKAPARKFSSLMRKPLFDAAQQRARTNGQSFRHVLESAVELYLQATAPASEETHPDIVARARRAIRKHDQALRMLAKAE